MAVLGDYLNPICQRVFDLLSAEPLWVAEVRPGARLSRFDPKNRWATIAPARKSPRAVWDFRLLRGVPRPADPRTGMTTTFASVASAAAPLILYKQYTLVHTLTHPDLVQTTAALLETLLELVLVRAGPQLVLNASPLAYCAGCLPVTSSYDESNTANPQGSPALVQTLTHPVDVNVTTADLLG